MSRAIRRQVENLTICLLYLFVFFRFSAAPGRPPPPADRPILEDRSIFFGEKVKNFVCRAGAPQPWQTNFVFSFEEDDKIPKSINLYFGQITVIPWYNGSDPRRKEARAWRQNTSSWQTGSGRS